MGAHSCGNWRIEAGKFKTCEPSFHLARLAAVHFGRKCHSFTGRTSKMKATTASTLFAALLAVAEAAPVSELEARDVDTMYPYTGPKVPVGDWVSKASSEQPGRTDNPSRSIQPFRATVKAFLDLWKRQLSSQGPQIPRTTSMSSLWPMPGQLASTFTTRHLLDSARVLR